MNARQRAVAVARETLGEDYVWGETDCASLVRRAIGAGPRWSGLREALRVDRATGGAPSWLERAGFGAVPATLARPGDVVTWPPLERSPFRSFCGVMVGPSRVLTSTPEDGVAVLRLGARQLTDTGATVWRRP